jgi:hypothetical protein
VSAASEAARGRRMATLTLLGLRVLFRHSIEILVHEAAG